MAGTITLGTPEKKGVGQSPSYKYDRTLTMDASGSLSGVAIPIDPGYLVAVDTIPDGVHAPADNYTLRLLTEDGVDLLAGGGSDRSSTSAQRLIGKPSIISGSLYPVIAGGGANAVVRLLLWVQGI